MPPGGPPREEEEEDWQGQEKDAVQQKICQCCCNLWSQAGTKLQCWCCLREELLIVLVYVNCACNDDNFRSRDRILIYRRFRNFTFAYARTAPVLNIVTYFYARRKCTLSLFVSMDFGFLGWRRYC